MTAMEIAAQAVGFLALGANIASFHFRKYRRIVLMQMLSSVLFTLHFLMLRSAGQGAAVTAGVLVTVSMSIRQPNRLRLLMMAAAPFAFSYDLLIGSIGGSINEAISFLSALIAFLRARNAPEPDGCNS